MAGDATLFRAMELLRSGKAAQAAPLLRRMLQHGRADPEASRLLSLCLLQLGEPAQAEYFARRAAEGRQDPAALDALGTSLALQGKHLEARDVFRAGLALAPDWPSLLNGVGGASLELGDDEAAAAAFATAAALRPDDPTYLNQHAWALQRGWRIEESLALLRAGVARWPEHGALRLQIAVLLNYTGGDHTEVRSHHAALGRILEREAGSPERPAFLNARDEKRPLRVALLSPDFKDHAVARFVEPLLASPPAGIELTCFASVRRPDAWTTRLRQRATAWVDIAEMNDAACAERMRRDRVDVAIDLAGHTIGSRVSVLAHWAAPVQMTGIGYPNTTGLRAVGWRLCDALTDPAGSEGHGTERLARLEGCFLCFQPPEAEAPPALPAKASGRITFGSFNALKKIGPRTLALWATVLDRVPGARLLIKAPGLETPAVRERLIDAAGRAGIDASRLEVLGVSKTIPEHLATYGRVDIALDCTPYNGTTTTCEALWMGVPVVTLAGDRHASRVGVSLLAAAGLPKWSAPDDDSFVRIACDLAADVGALADMRWALRGQIEASMLCDARGYSQRFAATVRSAWADWCRDGV